ncbi:MAG: hypothetical protein KC469_00510 [Flavobacteriaceae bacterium]|nr:hypothetical protein [Flavobacteriaceae bacterium]
MFLKRFKEKSNQKYINNVLNNRDVEIHNDLIESVGVIVKFDEFNSYDDLRQVFKHLGITDNKVKFIAYINDEKLIPSTWDTFFYPKCFGWGGNINNNDVNEFINQKFDALISYYKEDNLELNMLTALSKANFKIGLSDKDPRLHDFIINIMPYQVDIFKTELKKYLRVLNKINV